jgi:hypothetical protein
MTRFPINITFLAFAVLSASFAQSRVIVETVEETYYPPAQVSEVTTYETTTTKQVSGKDFAVFVLAMGGAVIVVGGIVVISASSDGASTSGGRSSGWGGGGQGSSSSSGNETAKLVTTGAAAGVAGLGLGYVLGSADGPDTKVTTVKRTTTPSPTPVGTRVTKRTTTIID